MKTHKIIRDESGRFVLRCGFGYPNTQFIDRELSKDPDLSKELLKEILSRVNETDIPLQDRQALIESINVNIPIPKKQIGIICDRSHRGKQHYSDPGYSPISQSQFSK